jgi:uncharacterized phage protein (TIGR01671 family)
MKREIKFRAWDGENMIFFEDFEITNTGNFWRGDREVWSIQSLFGKGEPESGLGYWHADFSEDANIIQLMQFTGLHDKNGFEIYEGDIICFKANYTSKLGGWMNGLVVITPLKLEIHNEYGKYDADEETDEFPYTCEVLGNIYQNPELL